MPELKQLRLTVGIACSCWLMMSALSPAGAVTVVFDYSYDSNGFFTPERRVLLERAAAEFTSRMTATTWARIDPTNSGGHYELAVINPSTLAVSWVTNAVIPTNQITVHVGAIDFTQSPFYMMTNSTGDGATQLLGVRNVSGAMTNLLANPALFRPVDASITFDLQGIKGFSSTINAQWYFSTNADLNLDDDPGGPSNDDYYSDFYGTAVHELGHVFGIHNPAMFQALLASDPNFCVAWMSKVQSDGQGGYVFTGAHAKQYYYHHIGANVPVDPDTLCHWADGVRSTPSNNWTSVTHEDHQPFRIHFSELEFAALQDLGYVIIPVPRASLSLGVTNSNLNLQMSGLFPYLQFYCAFNTDLSLASGWTNALVMVPTGTVATVSQPLPTNVSRLYLELRR